MEYKIHPDTGELRMLAKTAKKPRYRPIYYDFFSSMRILHPSEVIVFFGIVQLMEKQYFNMSIPTKTELCEMTGMHKKTIERAVFALVNKGFLLRKRSKEGRIIKGGYMVNPYFATERADLAFTLRNRDRVDELDGACLHVVDQLQEYDAKKYGSGVVADEDDGQEDFE